MEPMSPNFDLGSKCVGEQVARGLARCSAGEHWIDRNMERVGGAAIALKIHPDAQVLIDVDEQGPAASRRPRSGYGRWCKPRWG